MTWQVAVLLKMLGGSMLAPYAFRLLGNAAPRERVYRITVQFAWAAVFALCITTAMHANYTVQNLQVAYRTPRGDMKYIVSSVIEILWEDSGPPFTLPGDSGSMVLIEDGLRPLGLHFAALETGRRSFVIPMKRICDIFEVQLVQ